VADAIESRKLASDRPGSSAKTFKSDTMRESEATFVSLLGATGSMIKTVKQLNISTRSVSWGHMSKRFVLCVLDPRHEWRRQRQSPYMSRLIEDV
jgi:hypothetical protein